MVAKLLHLTEGGQAITLVKPQFELAGMRGSGGRPPGGGSSGANNSGGTEVPPTSEEGYSGSGEFQGVIRDRRLIQELLRTVVAELATDGIVAADWLLSPVPGRRGNVEAFFRFLPRGACRGLSPEEIVIGEESIQR